jgi:hypothetical protein
MLLWFIMFLGMLLPVAAGTAAAIMIYAFPAVPTSDSQRPKRDDRVQHIQKH